MLSNPNDTIYLAGGEDSVYSKNGKYYHISNGWNPPDSLKPYKKVTYFFIVDIRNYSRQKAGSYKTYQFDSENDFKNKRAELNVPDKLDFSIVDSTLL